MYYEEVLQIARELAPQLGRAWRVDIREGVICLSERETSVRLRLRSDECDEPERVTIVALAPTGGYLSDDGRTIQISVNARLKSPRRIAGEIERRLLPDARFRLAELQEEAMRRDARLQAVRTQRQRLTAASGFTLLDRSMADFCGPLPGHYEQIGDEDLRGRLRFWHTDDHVACDLEYTGDEDSVSLTLPYAPEALVARLLATVQAYVADTAAPATADADRGAPGVSKEGE